MAVLEKQQKQLSKAQSEANTLTAKQAGSVNELKANLKAAQLEFNQLSKEQRESTQRGQELANTITVTNKEIRRISDSARNQVQAFDKANATYRQTSDRLSALKKELREIPGALDKSSQAYQKNAQRVDKLEKEIGELDQELKSFDKTLGENFRNVGNYEGAIDKLIGSLGGLKEGFVQTAQSGGQAGALGVIQGGVGALGSFVPQIALAAGALAGLAEGFEFVAETAAEVNAELRLINQQLGLTGAQADDARARISALGDTFDFEFNETLKAANVLTRDFGISYGEALDLIEDASLRGANATGDLLEQISEYGPQFADANASAEDLIATIGIGVTTGAFGDKAADTVKEFGLRIRELTPAAEEALSAFDDQTEAQIRQLAAADDTIGALQLVTGALGDLDVQARQTAIADLFGGPGEDLGLERLIALGEGTDFLTRELTDLEAQQKRLLDSNEEVQRAQGRLADAFREAGGGVNTFGNRLKAFGIDLLTELILIFKDVFAAFSDFGTALSDLFKEIFPVREETSLLTTVTEALSKAIRIVIAPTRLFIRFLQRLFERIKPLVTGIRNFVSGILDLAKNIPIIGRIVEQFQKIDLSNFLDTLAQVPAFFGGLIFAALEFSQNFIKLILDTFNTAGDAIAKFFEDPFNFSLSAALSEFSQAVCRSPCNL